MPTIRERLAGNGFEGAAEARQIAANDGELVSGQVAYNVFHRKPVKTDVDIFRFETDNMWVEPFFVGSDREREIYQQLDGTMLKKRAFHSEYKPADTIMSPDELQLKGKSGSTYVYKNPGAAATTRSTYRDLRAYLQPEGGAEPPSSAPPKIKPEQKARQNTGATINNVNQAVPKPEGN
jgi:hypothetical protein